MIDKERSHDLYFCEGSSNKVYNMQLIERDDGWNVAYQYGKRHNVSNRGIKFFENVLYSEASKAYAKLLDSKLKKGYTLTE